MGELGVCTEIKQPGLRHGAVWTGACRWMEGLPSGCSGVLAMPALGEDSGPELMVGMSLLPLRFYRC